MELGVIYKNIALLSPYIEVMLRKLYWKNVKRLRKYSPYGSGVENSAKKTFNFEEVINYLKNKGVGEGSLLVVHSSFDNLASCGLKPQEIIMELRHLIGESGTLAMPAIRTFKGEPAGTDILSGKVDGLVCEYDVKRSPIISGMLPFTLLRMKDSEISHFPYNPLVAIGPLAKPMMEHNLDGHYPSAHGKMSSWKFCLDHDAIVVGLGVDLEHHNTMAHVMEEAFDDWRWSNEEWYRERLFDIVNEEKNRTRVTVYERKPEWGTMCIAELNFASDLYKTGIIERKYFGETPICIEKAQALRDYLQARNKTGFPYYKF